MAANRRKVGGYIWETLILTAIQESRNINKLVGNLLYKELSREEQMLLLNRISYHNNLIQEKLHDLDNITAKGGNRESTRGGPGT